MKIIASAGREDIAMVYIAEIQKGKLVEFVESIQPPLPRRKKWVLIISSLFGCPVKCLMCDAGGKYKGKLSREELFTQIDYLIKRRFPTGIVPVEKFKIQFARMGEPSLNPNVLDVLNELPQRYQAPGLIPSLSTIAPQGRDKFFEKLLQIKKRLYKNGHFQLQFSIHTTDENLRNWLIPVKKWDFAKIADYGKEFYGNNDRKITLNFALIKGIPLEPDVLSKYFDPETFLIKITPLNPTYQVLKNKLSSYIDPHQNDRKYEVIKRLQKSGYEVILSIGELEENYIGSNCGQYLTKFLEAKSSLKKGYKYKIQY